MDVFQIAAWFVKKEPMNHLKLQGLVYLAYFWYERKYQKALFDTRGYEALPMMPTEPELARKYQNYGQKKIRSLSAKMPPKAIQRFLKQIYETYGMADGEALASYLRQNEAYQKARQRQTDYMICREDMRTNDQK